MERFQSVSGETMQWVYIAVVVVLVALVFGLSWRRRDDDAQSVFNTMAWFEDWGLGAIYQILVIMGVFGMAWVGWRLPAEIESYAAGGFSSPNAFPLTGNWVARLGQVIGATGFAVIAMRSMRYVVPVIGVMLLCVAVFSAISYVAAAI